MQLLEVLSLYGLGLQSLYFYTIVWFSGRPLVSSVNLIGADHQR
jgi:hypothetical protein